ncbi:Ribosome biogenesis protein Kri1 [Coemansia asiatica]|uniref:Ribosome biogenesis protein Kri1 n=1 Tax=Coemansia asiatica TaxID=1052880 RepID=A0A9W8CLN9_9FUNG|nr:Ribosome biogenesis protein Kri1 [Coemansia asiatica]
MSDHSDIGIDSAADAEYMDIAKIDKKKLLRAEERRRRAGDDYGEIENYLSDIEGSKGNEDEEDDDYEEQNENEKSSEGSSAEESDIEEDENGELITPELDAQIIKTLTALRSKDRCIYDSNINFFSEDEIKKSQERWRAKQDDARKKAESGMSLREYQHKIMVEHGGVVDEDKEIKESVGMTHVQEQEALKNELKAALGDALGDEEEGEDDNDDLLVKKVKTEEELAKEDHDYRKFLLDNMGMDVENNRAFASWVGKSADSATDAETDKTQAASKMDADQEFLMNYILNRGWVDKNVGKISSEQEAKLIVDNEEDQKIVELTDNFESKYNFRFEEEGGTQIKTYPREIEGSVRRKDERRKLARERAKERKLGKKREKAEELKRIKNLKKKEILEKLKEIQGITGNKTVGFDTLDLDGDFDPSKFDSQMETIFSGDYYKEGDTEKPTWDDDIDIGDIVGEEEEEEAEQQQQQSKKGKRSGKKGKEAAKRSHGNDDDDDFIMDADYLDDANQNAAVNPEAFESTKAELKDKVSEYLDNYYQLDFEDVVGDDLATRFKYAKVKPVNYGLTPAEILLADDKFLNEYVSVKKIATYRPDWRIDDDMTKHANKKRMVYVKKKAAVMREEWMNTLKQAKSGKKDKKDKKKKREMAGDKAESTEGKSSEKNTKAKKNKIKADSESATSDVIEEKKAKDKKHSSSETKDYPDASSDKKMNRRQRQKAKKNAALAATATSEN